MKIKVEPLLPTGNYLNVRIGIEKDFPDGDNELECVFSVWDNIIAMHMKRYPHLYNEKGEPLYEKIPEGDEFRGTQIRTISGEQEQQVEKPISNEDKKKQQISSFVEAITTCNSLKALDIFTKLVERENIAELYEAYHSTKKRLENEQH